MPFTVQDFQDLLAILEQQPAWRAQLRQRVLTDEFTALPSTVQEVAARQDRTDEQLAILTEQVLALTDAQNRTDGQIRILTLRIDALTEQVQVLTSRIDRLADRLDKRLSKMDDELGKMKGILLEMRYRERPHILFRRVLRRAKLLSPDELYRRTDQAIEAGQINEEEAEDLLLADVVARGRHLRDDQEIYGVVEVSWGIGPNDVARAAQRATILAKTGVQSVAIVAGEWITPDAISEANREQVWRVLDGATIEPELTPPLTS
jgi:ribosomal protein S15P/S13E